MTSVSYESKIHRKKRVNPYIVVDKSCSNDIRLSWKAKGLHTYLMGLPDTWDIRVKDLIKRSTDGRDSVRAGICELEKLGYVTREKVRNEAGKICGVDYTIHEVPVFDNTQNDADEILEAQDFYPETDFPAPVFPAPANPPQIINNINKYPSNKVNKAAAIVTTDRQKRGDTAAAFCSDNNPQNQSKQSFAEIDQLNSPINFDEEMKLTNDLSELQRQKIAQKAKKLADKKLANGMRIEDIVYQLTLLMLDEKRFSKAHQSGLFAYKLNVICQAIEEGTCVLKSEVVNPKVHPVNEKLKMLEDQRHRAAMEIASCQGALKSLLASDQRFREAQEKSLEDAKANLNQILADIEKEKSLL